MKSVRFGEPGQEKPGVVDQQGRVRDVSSRVSDWTGEALNPAWLAEFSATDIASFPIVPAGVRLGPPVPTAGNIICIGLTTLVTSGARCLPEIDKGLRSAI
jgi:hypothetical protein